MKKTEFLKKAEVRIDNSIGDPKISQALSMYGYTGEKLGEGKQLLQDAKAKHLSCDNWKSELDVAYDRRNKKKEEADGEFKVLRTLAKLAFKTDLSAQLALRLNTPMPQDIPGWENLYETFYTNLLNSTEWITKMTMYNMTQEKIEGSFGLFQKTIELSKEVLKTKGESQQATQDRNKACALLETWISEFDTIAQLALHDSPQLLEKLGMVVKA